jgi:hypothetical protein
LGGLGGWAPPSSYYTFTAGAGGTGLNFDAAGTITNTGTIIGGAGGDGGTDAASGGAGVFLGGGTLTTSGTIVGGLGGTSQNGIGIAGNAVQFGTLAATLVLLPGASFTGLVAANTAVDDTLVLGGATPSSLSGLGADFAGFTTITESSGASWTLSGLDTIGAGTTFTVAGNLATAGNVTASGTMSITGVQSSVTVQSGAALFAGVALSGGTLAETTEAIFVIGTTLAGAQPGPILIEPGATISGFGTIETPGITDNGTISAQGGTLSLNGPLTGSGVTIVDSGATLLMNGDLRLASLTFAGADATLKVDPLNLSTTISGFGANDTIDLANIHATSVSFSTGTLTVFDGQHLVSTLLLDGDYTTGDFTLARDGHNGSKIGFASADVTKTLNAGPFVANPYGNSLLRVEAFAGMHPHAGFG